MSSLTRPLAGWRVGLSISESEDGAERGFPKWQVNRTTLMVVSSLFGQGVGVVFGHDWRDDGVMEAVHGLAQHLQSQPPPSDHPEAAPPLLMNLVPWPDHPRLSEEEQLRLASTLQVKKAGLPEELLRFAEGALLGGPESPEYNVLRAKALTHLRIRMQGECGARLCLGGATTHYQGFYPGIVEEAFLALQAGAPLYVSGLLGGAALQIVNAIHGGAMPDDFCPLDRRGVDRRDIWAAFRRARFSERTNGLDEDQNKELFGTSSLDRVIQLVLTGLSRLPVPQHLSQ